MGGKGDPEQGLMLVPTSTSGLMTFIKSRGAKQRETVGMSGGGVATRIFKVVPTW